MTSFIPFFYFKPVESRKSDAPTAIKSIRLHPTSILKKNNAKLTTKTLETKNKIFQKFKIEV